MQQAVSLATPTNNSAFTTLGNSNSDFNNNSNLDLKWNKEYICGFKYQFSSYYYIVK